MRGFYEVLTEGSEILSASDAKAFMRIDTSADDTLIETLITAARVSAERLTNRSFITRTWRASFPGGSGVEIKKSPVTSITTVKEWNSETQTYDAVTGSIFSQTNEFSCVEFPEAIPVPDDTAYGVQITFAGGYGSTNLPKALLQALKMHVAYLYENRGDVEAVGGVAMPAACELIYRQYRIISTYG